MIENTINLRVVACCFTCKHIGAMARQDPHCKKHDLGIDLYYVCDDYAADMWGASPEDIFIDRDNRERRRKESE